MATHLFCETVQWAARRGDTPAQHSQHHSLWNEGFAAALQMPPSPVDSREDPSGGKSVGPGDMHPRAAWGFQLGGLSKLIYQCHESTSAQWDHTCLGLHLQPPHCAELSRSNSLKQRCCTHLKEGFKEAIQFSRWWVLPFPLTSLSWQNQLFAGLGHWNVFCFICFLCYYCISVNWKHNPPEAFLPSWVWNIVFTK